MSWEEDALTIELALQLPTKLVAWGYDLRNDGYLWVRVQNCAGPELSVAAPVLHHKGEDFLYLTSSGSGSTNSATKTGWYRKESA